MSTYAEIETDVISWLNRTGFTNLEAEVPTFMAMAQNRIWRNADLNAMLVEASFNSDTPTVPTGLLRVKSMTTTRGSQPWPLNGAPLKKVIAAGTLSTPTLYTIVGTDFRFGPTPDAVYTMDVIYYAALTNIAATTDTTWVSDNWPELILFGTLLEACLWLKDDARSAVWEGRFSATLAEIEESEEKMAREGGSLQVTNDMPNGYDSTRLN